MVFCHDVIDRFCFPSYYPAQHPEKRMNMSLPPPDKYSVDAFMRRVWWALYKSRRKRPDPTETVVASAALAKMVVDQANGISSVSPSRRRSALEQILTKAERIEPSDELIAKAQAALAYIDQNGDAVRYANDRSRDIDCQSSGFSPQAICRLKVARAIMPSVTRSAFHIPR